MFAVSGKILRGDGGNATKSVPGCLFAVLNGVFHQKTDLWSSGKYAAIIIYYAAIIIYIETTLHATEENEMLFRLIFLLVLAAGVGVFSEPVGDFAPLEVGNLWEYKCISHSSSMYGMYSSNDSSLARMQITDSEVSGDTLLFYLRTHKNGRRIEDTTAIDTAEVMEPETTFYDYVVYDTIYELDGVIKPKTPWYGGPVPVFTYHNLESMDAGSTGAPYTLTDTSGTWELWCSFASFGIERQERYRVDTGLVQADFWSNLHGAGGEGTYELISFTRVAPVAIAPALRRHRVSGIGTASGNPSTLLQLPHLSIINRNGSVVNLLGRMEEPARRIIPGQLFGKTKKR